MQTKIAHLTAVALAAAALFGMQNASANVGAPSVSGHAGGVIIERETTPGTVRDGHVAQAGGVILENAPATVRGKEHVAGSVIIEHAPTTVQGEAHVAGVVILERERSPGTARDGDGHIAGGMMLENAPATIKNEDEHVAGGMMLEKAPTTVRDEDEHVASGMILENAPETAKDGDSVVAIWVQ